MESNEPFSKEILNTVGIVYLLLGCLVGILIYKFVIVDQRIALVCFVMIFFSLYYVIEKISTDLVISNFSLFCYGVYFGVLLYSVYVLLTISIIEAIETIVAAIVIYIVGMIFTWIVPGC